MGDGGWDVACWKMLAHTSQVGAVMGRGGQNIRRVRTETGAQIRILPAPHWTAEDDVLIQVRDDERDNSSGQRIQPPVCFS